MTYQVSAYYEVSFTTTIEANSKEGAERLIEAQMELEGIPANIDETDCNYATTGVKEIAK